MSELTKIAERFKRETAGHQMTVLHDDGLYRHLRFMNPEFGSISRFDLHAALGTRKRVRLDRRGHWEDNSNVASDPPFQDR